MALSAGVMATVAGWLWVTAAGKAAYLAVRGRYKTGDTHSSDSGSRVSS